jgi:hypothetical protein
VHGSRLRNLVGLSVYAGACNATLRPPVRRTWGNFNSSDRGQVWRRTHLNDLIRIFRPGKLVYIGCVVCDVAILKEGTIIIYREEKTHVVSMFRSEWNRP